MNLLTLNLYSFHLSLVHYFFRISFFDSLASAITGLWNNQLSIFIIITVVVCCRLWWDTLNTVFFFENWNLFDWSNDYKTINQQETIPVRCVPPVCADHNSFNRHQLALPRGLYSDSGHVSSDGHKQGAGTGTGAGGIPGLMSGGLGQGQVWGFPGLVSIEFPGPMSGGRLYSEVQFIMGNGHMGTPMDRHIPPVKTLPSRNSIGGRGGNQSKISDLPAGCTMEKKLPDKNIFSQISLFENITFFIREPKDNK